MKNDRELIIITDSHNKHPYKSVVFNGWRCSISYAHVGDISSQRSGGGADYHEETVTTAKCAQKYISYTRSLALRQAAVGYPARYDGENLRTYIDR